MAKKRNDRKAERRAEAETRNAAWAKLTLQQQLDALKKRPGNSARQVARILATDPSLVW